MQILNEYDSYCKLGCFIFFYRYLLIKKKIKNILATFIRNYIILYVEIFYSNKLTYNSSGTSLKSISRISIVPNYFFFTKCLVGN